MQFVLALIYGLRTSIDYGLGDCGMYLAIVGKWLEEEVAHIASARRDPYIPTWIFALPSDRQTQRELRNVLHRRRRARREATGYLGYSDSNLVCHGHHSEHQTTEVPSRTPAPPSRSAKTFSHAGTPCLSRSPVPRGSVAHFRPLNQMLDVCSRIRFNNRLWRLRSPAGHNHLAQRLCRHHLGLQEDFA